MLAVAFSRCVSVNSLVAFSRCVSVQSLVAFSRCLSVNSLLAFSRWMQTLIKWVPVRWFSLFICSIISAKSNEARSVRGCAPIVFTRVGAPSLYLTVSGQTLGCLLCSGAMSPFTIRSVDALRWSLVLLWPR